MVCSPNDNSVNPPIGQPPTIPSLGVLNAPIQFPLPDIQLPTQMVENLVDLMNQLGAQFPSGLFKANPDNYTKSVWDFIANLFNQLAPFLSFYNFVMACFQMITCVIEVLCAIPNPFALASKLKKLFTQCLPPFMNLFPAFALVTMIISLLLLILALIEYIISTTVTIIEDLIKNIEALATAQALNDPEASLAIVHKIASLLCIIQNILTILTALQAIIAIIEALSKLASGTICDDNDTEGCCPPELCPTFIKNTPNGIQVLTGKLIYLSQINADLQNLLSLSSDQASLISVPAIRQERWQIFDAGLNSDYPINSIIQTIQDNIFWPEDVIFSKNTPLKKAPYTVDVTITLDPKIFGHADVKGSRKFLIKNCIVVKKPYIGTYTYNNSIDLTNGFLGTLNIEGGLVFEEDGSAYMQNNSQLTLNEFIHLNSNLSSVLPNEDDIKTFDIEFIWKPNAPALAGYDLITIGCIPEVNIEKATQNAILVDQGVEALIAKLPATPEGIKVSSTGTFLPNVNGSLQCVNEAIAELRKNVSIENAAIFQATIEICLNDLKNQTSFTLCAALISAVSNFKSEIKLSTDLQFISSNIDVLVYLKDNAGVNLTISLPQTCADEMAAKLTAEVSLGSISKFIYNSEGYFKATLKSNELGTGNISILFNEKVLSKITVGQVGGNASKIEEISLPYSFIGVEIEPPVRRDESDLI